MGSGFTILLRVEGAGGDPFEAAIKWGLGLEYNAKETVTQVLMRDLVIYSCFVAHQSHDDLHSSAGKELRGTYSASTVRLYKEVRWSPPGRPDMDWASLRKITHTGSLKQEYIKIISKYHKDQLQIMQ